MSRRPPGPERLGAFSDGVIAIIITIMVLELHVPHEATVAALLALWPTFLSYALSYLIVAIIWINHHHLVHHMERATSGALWTNLLLLFFVSLIPFFTEWMAESRLARVTTAMYAVNFVATSLAFILFERQVAAQLDPEDRELALSRRLANRRNWIGFGLYALAVPAACFQPWIALALMFLNAVLYLLPDARTQLRRLQGSR